MCAYFCHFHPFPGSLSKCILIMFHLVPKKYVCHGRNSATTPCRHDTIACRLAGEVDSAHHAAPLAALDLVAGILRSSHHDSEQKMNPPREARRRVRLSSTFFPTSLCGVLVFDSVSPAPSPPPPALLLPPPYTYNNNLTHTSHTQT